MIKIEHGREVSLVLDLPPEVVQVVRDAVTILDEAYGEGGDSSSGYGGCVLVIDGKDDFEKLKDLRVDLDTAIPEYVDVIECANGQTFASSLLLLGSDFGVLLIMPVELLTANLRDYIHAVN